jgi:DNA-binding protein H-NS
MVSVTHAAHEIEVTAESLQEDLARLEVQKQALERELAAVKAHLGSVQRALGALQTLMSAAGSAPPGAVDATATHETGGATRVEPRREPATTAPLDEATASDEAGGQQKYGKLTEQILDYFAGAGDTVVRARDVAEALGRATDSGSINAVRSTLDRLVGTSRIHRAGRGLYRGA